MIFADPDGATPLSPEERDELIPDHITTRKQLNEWEHANILEAQVIFSEIWTSYVGTDAGVGVPPESGPLQLRISELDSTPGEVASGREVSVG